MMLTEELQIDYESKNTILHTCFAKGLEFALSNDFYNFYKNSLSKAKQLLSGIEFIDIQEFKDFNPFILPFKCKCDNPEMFYLFLQYHDIKIFWDKKDCFSLSFSKLNKKKELFLFKEKVIKFLN